MGTESSTEPAPSADPDIDLHFLDTRNALLAPPAFSVGPLLLIGSLVLFLTAQGQDRTWREALIVLAVITFHELGHAAGMRLFGYRDVSIFFIPFFGGAAVGQRGSASTWKEAVVLLLGPLPGLILGTVILVRMLSRPSALGADLAWYLLAINGFNLLPLGSLDGGKFLQRVVFSRHHVLESGFEVLASLALLGVAVVSGDMVLGAFGVLGALGLPARVRARSVAAELRRQEPGFPADPAALDARQQRVLYDLASRRLPEPHPATLATGMRSVLDAMHAPPGWFASLVLLGTWGASFLLLIVCVFLAGFSSEGENWQRVQAGTVASAEGPGEFLPPRLDTFQTPSGAIPVESHVRPDGLTHRYTVLKVDLREVPAERRMAALRETMVAIFPELKLTKMEPTAEGAEGELHDFDFARQFRAIQTPDGFVVGLAGAPVPGASAVRFLGSLQLTGAAAPN